MNSLTLLVLIVIVSTAVSIPQTLPTPTAEPAKKLDNKSPKEALECNEPKVKCNKEAVDQPNVDVDAEKKLESTTKTEPTTASAQTTQTTVTAADGSPALAVEKSPEEMLANCKKPEVICQQEQLDKWQNEVDAAPRKSDSVSLGFRILLMVLCACFTLGNAHHH